jgi:phage baseplate assembly protein W
MFDLSLTFSGDLVLSATGDLATVDGSDRSQQRVLRRLLTNPGDYIWQPPYGAGLAQFIGQPIAAQRIAAVARAQMLKEAAVSRSPAPVVNATVATDGTATLNVQYTDSTTQAPVVLTVPVGGA